MAYSIQGESSSSSTSNFTRNWKLDVFLSFHGKDTRLGFTDHLYAALTKSGITAFRDNEGLGRGEFISQQLLQSIEDSLSAVIVISQNFAHSTWCLDELHQILECRKKLGRRVYPIFYGVDPSDIRYLRNSFGEAVAKHEERFRANKDKVQNWKNALSEVSYLSGWDTRGRAERDVISDITEAIWNYLCSKLTSLYYLDGTESRLVETNLPRKRMYDIFLSFRGEDTRDTFTDHLHAALKRSGIRAFKDTEIRRGINIAPQLLRTLEDSHCAIVILSKHYADSSWCLDELCKILELKNTLGQHVLPVFYEVDPSDVRHQRGSFGDGFARLEKRFGEDRMQKWRRALLEVSNSLGWHIWHRPESEVIQEIVTEVCDHLCSESPTDYVDPIKNDSRMDAMDALLGLGLDEVCFVGILGMNTGIGKTTFSKAVFDRISDKFELCCYLANIGELLEGKDLVHLQRELLSRLNISISKKVINDKHGGRNIIRYLFHSKKVLLVLDDISHVSQLEYLAASPKWFGAGSRVIITTNDRHLLWSLGMRAIYKVQTMRKDEYLYLFSKESIQEDHPKEDYGELS